jgi:hypothetical protein
LKAKRLALGRGIAALFCASVLRTVHLRASSNTAIPMANGMTNNQISETPSESFDQATIGSNIIACSSAQVDLKPA